MGFHTYLAHAISKAKGENLSMQKMITTSQWMYPRQKSSKDMDEKKGSRCPETKFMDYFEII